MRMQKPFAAAVLALSLTAQQATATGFVEPVMEPEVIAEAAAPAVGGWVVPLIFLAVIAAAAAASGGGGSGSPTPLPPPVR